MSHSYMDPRTEQKLEAVDRVLKQLEQRRIDPMKVLKRAVTDFDKQHGDETS